MTLYKVVGKLNINYEHTSFCPECGELKEHVGDDVHAFDLTIEAGTQKEAKQLAVENAHDAWEKDWGSSFYIESFGVNSIEAKVIGEDVLMKERGAQMLPGFA